MCLKKLTRLTMSEYYFFFDLQDITGTGRVACFELESSGAWWVNWPSSTFLFAFTVCQYQLLKETMFFPLLNRLNKFHVTNSNDTLPLRWVLHCHAVGLHNSSHQVAATTDVPWECSNVAEGLGICWLSLATVLSTFFGPADFNLQPVRTWDGKEV